MKIISVGCREEEKEQNKEWLNLWKEDEEMWKMEKEKWVNRVERRGIHFPPKNS